MGYHGFELGTNTFVFANIEEEQFHEEPTSNLLSKCYQDFPVEQPLFIKHLIGRKLSDLKLHSPNYLIGTQVSEGPDGFPVFHGKNNLQVSIPQLLSKSLSCLWDSAHSRRVQKSLCFIGIPIYFTDLQRRIVLDAAQEAGFITGTLVHETTASAIEYQKTIQSKLVHDGIGKLNVIFVDMGVSSMQVCVAEHVKHELCVLAHSFDYSLGGRAFDEVLVNHFLAKFNEEHGFDATKDVDLYLQLYNVCEKMKIELSSSDEASFEICWGSKNFNGSMKREEFEGMCTSLLERVEGPLEMALEDAGLSVEDIHSVENVGFASKIPAIIKKMTDFFGRQPNQVELPKDKMIARGCSSKSFLGVEESFPFSIAMSWDKNKVTIEGPSVIFPYGSSLGSSTKVPYSSNDEFYLDITYDSISDSKMPTTIVRFKFRDKLKLLRRRLKTDKIKVQDKFAVTINESGILEIELRCATRVTDDSFQKDVGSSSGLKALEDQQQVTKTSDEDLNAHEKSEAEISDISKRASELVFYDCDDDE